MTVIIEYPRQDNEKNKEWFERMETKNIIWSQWGGWFDSDGSFVRTGKVFNITLSLKDRDPVELFSKTFESSLTYQEHYTNPYNKDHVKTPHLAKEFRSTLRGPRALWFANKIKKYILNKSNHIKPFLEKQNITYIPYSEEWTREEWIPYLTTLCEGDGTYVDKLVHKRGYYLSLNSSNESFLKYISDNVSKHNILIFGKIYTIQGHPKDNGTRSVMYKVFSKGNMDQQKIYLETLIPFMTMGRKRQNAINTVEWINSRL
jgi:hypothetical protein